MVDPFIKHLVDRFLQWKLPENFNPDGGVSFKREFNENTDHPMRHEPSGTNLLDATQAEEMVRFMVEGAPKGDMEKIKSDVIGRIGAKLLARHSPQAVLDAYFDAANEELEQ